MKQGLILVDIQNDYFAGGRMELAGMERAALNAQAVLRRLRDAQTPVFHVWHVSNRPGSTFFLPGTAGVEIHELVAPRDGEPVIEKHFPNSFRETALPGLLEGGGIEEVVICGAMSHMCIDATTRAAFDFGYRCVVVHDACARRDVQFGGETIEAAKVHAAFMAALAGTYAQVISTCEFMGAGA